MAELKQKIKLALDEARMLVLGTQVLVGFQYRVVFEATFEAQPRASKVATVVALALLLFAFVLITAPAPRHRLVERGEDSKALHSYATTLMALALAPFAAGLGIDVGIATRVLAGGTATLAAAAVTFGVALFMWYGIELLRRRSSHHQEVSEMDEPREKTPLHDKIDKALTECRVVLPGAQALLGFQFAMMFVEGFEKLPRLLKWVHFGSLIAVALSTVLLMTPAAYHRLVEKGEDTEHFHRFASVMLLVAMAVLAIGMCGDFYVVVAKVAQSPALALSLSLALYAFVVVMWFGVSAISLERRRRSRRMRVEFSPSAR